MKTKEICYPVYYLQPCFGTYTRDWWQHHRECMSLYVQVVTRHMTNLCYMRNYLHRIHKQTTFTLTSLFFLLGNSCFLWTSTLLNVYVDSVADFTFEWMLFWLGSQFTCIIIFFFIFTLCFASSTNSK